MVCVCVSSESCKLEPTDTDVKDRSRKEFEIFSVFCINVILSFSHILM